jgi:CIC family chloride channel protein
VGSYKDESVKIKLKDLILKYISTIVTLGFGGSGGLVSPILFIGKGLAEFLNRKTVRIFSIAFASGMLTFYLGTPLSAVLLTIEYLERDTVDYKDIMPAFLAAAVSYYHHTLMGYEPVFLHKVSAYVAPVTNISSILLLFLLAVIFGGIGMGIYFLKWAYRKWTSKMKSLQKSILSAALVSLTAIFLSRNALGLRVLYGPATGGEAKFLTAKILATVFTIESVGSSGYFTPLTVIGMNLGYVFSSVGINQGVASVIGISAILSSALNIPITAVVFPLELFGRTAVIPAVIGSSVAYMIYKKFRLE